MDRQQSPLTCGSPLAGGPFNQLRRRMVLDFCKWDPQVEDQAILCPFPLLLDRDAWQQLARWSEQLADETLRAEADLLDRPESLDELGLPRSIRHHLQRQGRMPRAVWGPRIMRFDFHWTTTGWRISEVNSDVPGGFIEAAAYTQLFAEAWQVTGNRFPTPNRTDDGKLELEPHDQPDRTACCSGLAGESGAHDVRPGIRFQPAGDPARSLLEAMLRFPARQIGLVHATAYTDDRQVMIYLARELDRCGLDAHLVSPADVQFERDHTNLLTANGLIRADLLMRFYPGEWLPHLGRRRAWGGFFAGSPTPLSNPATALITQSKRFPLVWDRFHLSLPTWRELLPETCDPRRVNWRGDDQWVLKPTWGRVGDEIGLRGVIPAFDWKKIAHQASWWPRYWAAQRRFEIVPIPAGQRLVYPVIGVYTVDHHVAGIYGRLASRPLIDHLAQDVPVFISTPAGQNSVTPSFYSHQEVYP